MEDNNTTVTESLLQLILELQTASASISDLTKGADSQTSQLASLKSEVARLKSVEEEERKEEGGKVENDPPCTDLTPMRWVNVCLAGVSVTG